MTDDNRREVRIEARRAFERALELKFLRRRETPDGAQVMIFKWPRSNNGTKHDRTVVILQFDDGSWSEFLDGVMRPPVPRRGRMHLAHPPIGRQGIDETEATLRLTVKEG